MDTPKKDPAIIGLTAHTAILHKLVSQGLEVLQPLGDHLRYDLAYYQNETAELIRIQCKAGHYDPLKGCVLFKNYNRSGGRGERRKYIGDAEYFGVYCAELNSVYLVPIDIATYASEVSLRVEPTKNNQQKKVIWARDYKI
ncbi:MAG TPA: group I intron-associated PD-(D/E)XK endonuclease [Ktedonosporobacter sp.]|nr:group I intron-associated PD-(D/E)XK endonuclease [Ktedonosporobacter sp.]